MGDAAPILGVDVINARLRVLKRQAEEKGLLASPPYGSDNARKAFLAGYETALMDIARGWLEVSDA